MKLSLKKFGLAALLGSLVCGVSTSEAQDGRNKFIDPSTVNEQEGSPWSFSTRAGLYSSYVWRGLVLYDQPSFQPSGGVFYDLGQAGTIGGSIWMHVPLGDNATIIQGFDQEGAPFQFELDRKFFELDGTVSYDLPVGDIATLSVGHIWYTDPGYGDETVIFRGQDVNVGEISPDTAEFYAGVSLDVPLQPVFTYYYDYRTLEYSYFSLNLSHTFECDKVKDFNLTPFATFGFATNAADDIQVYGKNGLVHVNVGMYSSLSMGDVEVKPIATYVFGTDGEEEGERAQDKFYFGVDVAYDFSI